MPQVGFTDPPISNNIMLTPLFPAQTRCPTPTLTEEAALHTLTRGLRVLTQAAFQTYTPRNFLNYKPIPKHKACLRRRTSKKLVALACSIRNSPHTNWDFKYINTEKAVVPTS